MPVPSATTALDAALHTVAAGHQAARLVSSLLTDDDPPLVVAVVGPSGVGKSTLVNHLAGGRVTDVGVLRPTTREAKEWLSPDRSLRLIDAPPCDQVPDLGLAPIHAADLAVVVTSQSRYADAATWSCLRQARETGIPVVIVVNRLGEAVADIITYDVADRAGEERVIAVHDGTIDADLAALRTLLDAAAADVASVRSLRRYHTAAPAAAAVRGLALELRIENERVAVLADAVEDAATTTSIPIAELAPAAAGGADELTDLACAAVDRTARSSTTALAEVWESLGLAAPRSDRLTSMRFEDIAAIEGWRTGTEASLAAAIRPRLLVRLAGDRIGDEAWRLAVDRERPVRGWMRFGLGAGADELRAERGGALAALLADRVAARLEIFTAAVPRTADADPDRLEALAGKLEDDHPPAPTPGFLIGAAV